MFAFEDTNMNEHQREIVAQLWGLYSGKPKSKKEVAEDMGVTYSRIRQVEVCCLRHILKNKNRNTLIIGKIAKTVRSHSRLDGLTFYDYISENHFYVPVSVNGSLVQ